METAGAEVWDDVVFEAVSRDSEDLVRERHTLLACGSALSRECIDRRGNATSRCGASGHGETTCPNTVFNVLQYSVNTRNRDSAGISSMSPTLGYVEYIQDEAQIFKTHSILKHLKVTGA